MILRAFATGSFFANCVIIGDEETRESFVIDPGDEPDKIINAVREERLAVKSILLTHGHLDHCGAAADIAGKYGAPVYIHPEDEKMYLHLKKQGQYFGIELEDPSQGALSIKEGDIFTAGDLQIKALHTPGHSPGGVSFLVNYHLINNQTANSDSLLISGDTIFNEGIGRTDLWGGSYGALVKSIREKIYTLPNGLEIICGHGGNTTVGHEKRYNPFVNAG